MQHYLPVKRDDPGSFGLEVTFANKQTARGLIDLGASFNIMPYSIYKKMGIGELQPSKTKLKMADKSQKKARGLLEDCLVRIGELIVPVDFLVLDLESHDDEDEEPYLLLGRTFMDTTNMEISMRDETIKMTVRGKTLRLEISDDNSPPLYTSKVSTNYFDEVMMK